MFLHTFKNTFKLLIRDKSLLFWSLVFPIVLGFFFTIALVNITKSMNFEPIDLVVKEDLREDKYFDDFLKELEDEDIIRINPGKSIDDEGITAYIKDYDKIVFKKSGIYESIIEDILNAYLRKGAMAEKILRKNPTFDLSYLSHRKSHIIDKSKHNLDFVNTFFYCLIGMQAMYGFSYGLLIIYRFEANLSTLAKRNAIAPLGRLTSLLSSICVGFIINFSVVLFTMLVFNKLYGVDFSDKLGPLILIGGLGSLFGVLFGILIGLSSKASIEVKNGLGIAISMVLSYLSGMMDSSMKLVIEENAPIINKFNPIALINDAIYSLYYYDGYDRYLENVKYLLILIIVFLGLTLILTRGRQYDSL